MKFTDEEGKVWEWRGLGEMGTMVIIHRVFPVHEFGGVKFEETGEERVVKKGEWYLSRGSWGEIDGVSFRIKGVTGFKYVILRPLQGE